MAGAIERMSRTVSLSLRARRAVVALSATVVLGLGAGALSLSPACTTTVTVNTAFVSGIVINTSLLLNGLGCSASSTNDVYKYVAVVIDSAHDVGGAGIFDCFADGVFGDLPGADAGPLNFAVWVFAYNKADFDAANAGGALTQAVRTLNGVYPDGGFLAIPVSSSPAAGSALQTLCEGASGHPATWVSACSAITQVGVQTLADCQPLALGPSTPTSCSLPVLLDAALATPTHD